MTEQKESIGTQKRYWNELVQLKTHSFYLSGYLLKNNKINYWINVVLAITSSSSIAGWAMWKSMGFIWGLLIALSQVLTAIKPILPFNKRAKFLGQLAIDLNDLFIHMESKWYQVANGSITDEDIHNLHIEIKKQRAMILNKYPDLNDLEDKKRLLEIAKEKTKIYFKNFYNV